MKDNNAIAIPNNKSLIIILFFLSKQTTPFENVVLL